jgi:hypothetical protein
MYGWMLVGKGAWIYLFIGIVLFVSSLPRGLSLRGRRKGDISEKVELDERKTQFYKPTTALFTKENHSCIGV